VGARFSARVQAGCEAHAATDTMGNVSFPAVMRPGRGVDYPPLSRAEVKERVSSTSFPPLGLHGLFLVDLYLYLLQS